jgi:hypothetical protein
MESRYWENQIEFSIDNEVVKKWSMKIFVEHIKIKAFVFFVSNMKYTAHTLHNKFKSMNVVNIFIYII